MPIKTKYRSPQAIRAEEMRNRELQANLSKNKNIYKTEKNVFPLLNIEGVNDNSILEGEYVNDYVNDDVDNAIALPISKNNNSNIIDNATPIEENKSWTNWFTQKATHIKPSNEVVPITEVYKSNFNAGKTKKNRKNKKTKIVNKKIKKTRKLNKRRK